MSPLAIRLILHIYAIAEPIDNITAPAVRETIQTFLAMDMIQPSPNGPCEYDITMKGQKWVQMICDTPFPVFSWVDPRVQA